jgi:hypothetical protein
VLKSQMKELLEQERANAKDIAEVIEEERAKVEARTPITEEVRVGAAGHGAGRLRRAGWGAWGLWQALLWRLATCIACFVHKGWAHQEQAR